MPKTPQDEIREAMHAERMESAEWFVAMCAEIEQAAFQAWMSSKPGELEKREAEYYTLQALQRIKDRINILKGKRPPAEAQIRNERLQQAARKQ